MHVHQIIISEKKIFKVVRRIIYYKNTDFILNVTKLLLQIFM